MQERTTGAIALRPTGNAQGVYFFVSLTTGQRLNCQSFTPLHFPQDVINSVRCLARRNPKGLNIRERDRRPFPEPEDGANDDDKNSTYAPSDDNNRYNKYDSDDKDSDNDNNANLHPPPAQVMAQGAAGVTIHDNAGVHQNENAGVHQTTKNAGVHKNVNTQSPQNGHNYPRNEPTIKT